VIYHRESLDRRHDEFILQIESYAVSRGCSFQGSPAYHDRLPIDEAERLQVDYSASGLAERLRCDKRIMNPSGRHLPLEAKTSYRKEGVAKYFLEAYQLGLHKAQRDGCLYAYRKVCGDAANEFGFVVNEAFDVQNIIEIKIPILIKRGNFTVCRSSNHCEDSELFYRKTFREWFPGVPVSRTNFIKECRGSGDPYAILSDKFILKTTDWRSLVDDFSTAK
jgi:hypothetical protein